MVSSGFMVLMQFLQVFNQIVYPLGIEELGMLAYLNVLCVGAKAHLSDDLRRLGIVNGLDILRHGIVVVAFLV